MSNPQFTVVIDGRENVEDGHGYSFDEWSVDTTRKNLSDIGSEGDYSVEGHEFDFAIERKSLDDLATCSGTKRDDHFEPQVQRGIERLDKYAIVVEASRWKVKRGNYYSNIHPNAILGTIDSWSKDSHYGVDFHLCENEYMAEAKTYALLSNWRGQI
jgi:ERCC4-type nuclease